MGFTKWYNYSFDFKTSKSKEEILNIIENEFNPISEKTEIKEEEEEKKVLCEFIERENVMAKLRHDILNININIKSNEDTTSENKESEVNQGEYKCKATLEVAPSAKFVYTLIGLFVFSPFLGNLSPVLFVIGILSPIILGPIYLFQRGKIRKIVEKKMADVITKIVNEDYEIKTDKSEKKKNTESDKYESLERISDLKEKGILSEEEFQKEKEKILGKNN